VLLEEVEPATLELPLADGAAVVELLRTHVAEVKPARSALEVEDLHVVTLRARGWSSYKTHSEVTSTGISTDESMV
jgi:hypothetical protein